MIDQDEILARIAIDRSALRMYGAGDDLASAAHALLAQQRATWGLAHKGYDSLTGVRVRELPLHGRHFRLQFNPGRIVSSTAKVDPASIKERKCFLCPAHLPAEQRGIPYGRYLVLCNPFPIFPEHFTLTHVEHIAQQIRSSFGDLLAFARLLAPQYTVFYNGPRCGASAPDHLHFQAGTRGFMPIDAIVAELRDTNGTLLNDRDGARIWRVDDGPRPFILLESADDGALVRAFESVYTSCANSETGSEEPMMNIIGLFEDGMWRILVFPRRVHRPSFYFAEGEARVLISPAAVDLGGVIITPREEDFEKVTTVLLAQMFAEICAEADTMDRIAKGI